PQPAGLPAALPLVPHAPRRTRAERPPRSRNMSTTEHNPPPEAEVLGMRGHLATIKCPYCGRRHSHTVREHGAQRFSPGCGMYRNPAERARGYVFTTPEKGNRP